MPRRSHAAARILRTRVVFVRPSLDNARSLHLCYRCAEAGTPRRVERKRTEQSHRCGDQRRAIRRIGRVAGEQHGGVRKVDGAVDRCVRGDVPAVEIVAVDVPLPRKTRGRPVPGTCIRLGPPGPAAIPLLEAAFSVTEANGPIVSVPVVLGGVNTMATPFPPTVQPWAYAQGPSAVRDSVDALLAKKYVPGSNVTVQPSIDLDGRDRNEACDVVSSRLQRDNAAGDGCRVQECRGAGVDRHAERDAVYDAGRGGRT